MPAEAVISRGAIPAQAGGEPQLFPKHRHYSVAAADAVAFPTNIALRTRFAGICIRSKSTSQLC